MKNHKQIDHLIQVKAYFSTDPVWLNLLHGDQTTRYSEVHCLFTVRHQPHTRVMRNVFLLVTNDYVNEKMASKALSNSIVESW